MFVRIKTSPNSPKKAVQIVDTFRTGNKAKQRIDVGTGLNENELKRMKELAEHLVMGRIANPISRTATVMDLSENFGIELSLPSVYQMMDQPDETVITNIQQQAFQAASGLMELLTKTRSC